MLIIYYSNKITNIILIRVVYETNHTMPHAFIAENVIRNENRKTNVIIIL